MSTILENLTKQLGGSLMGQIGNEIGADRETTERATAAGLTTTAEELFDTSVLDEAFGGKTTL